MEVLRFGFASIAWLLALGAFAAAVLAQGGRFSARLDVLTHFAPVWLAAALLALALALLAPRSGRTALIAVSLLAGAAATLPILPEVLSRGRDPRAPPDAPGQVKVIQFNAWGQNARTDAAAAW